MYRGRKNFRTAALPTGTWFLLEETFVLTIQNIIVTRQETRCVLDCLNEFSVSLAKCHQIHVVRLPN